MRVVTSGILATAKIWLLIVAVAIASLALAPGSRPADAVGQPGQTGVYFTFSITNPIPTTNIVLAINGEPRKVYVWVEDPKDLDWSSGVGAYEVEIRYDPTLVTLSSAERGDECLNSTDDDGDTVINDGCPQVGGAPEIDQCYNIVDDDGDGFINDGCPELAPPAESNKCANFVDDDGDLAVNDGCPAVGLAETGLQCANAEDDDNDTWVNDGCPQLGGAPEINECWDGLDNEGQLDGAPDDGCSVDLELGDQCLNSTDDDGDTIVNDGCPTDAAPETACNEAPGFAVDDDFDLFINDGCPPDGSEVGTQCDNNTDDDGDEVVNDGCPAHGPGAETACDDAIDDDGDGFVNDGCPANSIPEVGAECGNDVDDDGDTVVNDGCPQVGPEETGVQCTETTGSAVDDDNDGKINDGCPETSSSEAGGQCLDAVDNDGDGLVNDGCPAKGAPEFACNDGVDDDGDGLVNDGCPPQGSVESAFQCGNASDDDGDGFVNDGCPQRGPLAVGNVDWLGGTGRLASCGTAYTRKVSGQNLWQFKLSCTSFAPPDQGVQVSGLLTSFWLLPGSQFGSAPFTFFAGSTALRTPGHVKVVGGVPTFKDQVEIPFSVLSALVQITRCGSIDGDNAVSFLDFLLMLQHFNEVEGVSPGWDKAIDLDNDSVVGFLDFLLMLGWFNRLCEPWL